MGKGNKPPWWWEDHQKRKAERDERTDGHLERNQLKREIVAAKAAAASRDQQDPFQEWVAACGIYGEKAKERSLLEEHLQEHRSANAKLQVVSRASLAYSDDLLGEGADSTSQGPVKQAGEIMPSAWASYHSAVSFPEVLVELLILLAVKLYGHFREARQGGVHTRSVMDDSVERVAERREMALLKGMLWERNVEVARLESELSHAKRETEKLRDELEELEHNTLAAEAAAEASRHQLQNQLAMVAEEARQQAMHAAAAEDALTSLRDEKQKLCQQLQEGSTASSQRIQRYVNELAELMKRNKALCDDVLTQKKATEDSNKKLESAIQRLSAIETDLSERLLCPLSFQPMRQPVIGADLRTYDKDVIEKSLDTKLASPFTRAFMEKGSLRPNLLVTELLELMGKHFPHWEDAVGDKRLPPVLPVKDELIHAIQSGKSDEAVELLGRDVDYHVLNGGYKMKGVNMSLLQICISVNLPKVAVAIIKRPEFRRTETFCCKGIQAIHMAAVYNMTDVCQSILADVGPSVLHFRTTRRAEMTDFNGTTVLIPSGSTALDCARLFGHTPEWALG